MKKILCLLAVAVLAALPGCKKVNLDKGIIFVERIDISQTEAAVIFVSVNKIDLEPDGSGGFSLIADISINELEEV